MRACSSTLSQSTVTTCGLCLCVKLALIVHAECPKKTQTTNPNQRDCDFHKLQRSILKEPFIDVAFISQSSFELIFFLCKLCILRIVSDFPAQFFCVSSSLVSDGIVWTSLHLQGKDKAIKKGNLKAKVLFSSVKAFYEDKQQEDSEC